MIFFFFASVFFVLRNYVNTIYCSLSLSDESLVMTCWLQLRFHKILQWCFLNSRGRFPPQYQFHLWLTLKTCAMLQIDDTCCTDGFWQYVSEVNYSVRKWSTVNYKVRKWGKLFSTLHQLMSDGQTYITGPSSGSIPC